MATELKLAKKTHLVDNVWSFDFEAPEPLEYTAGEYVRVKLDHDNPDDEGPKRFFTDSAPPYLGIVQITTRITDSTFKQALSKLEVGDTSMKMLKAPEGDFLWRDTDRKAVMIAGGIGVTPYHSILLQRDHDDLSIPVTLLYNGRTDALPWKDVFADLESRRPEFSVQYQIGERISVDSLTATFPDLMDSLVYLSGPEQMVEDIGEELKKAGLPEDQLVQDWFPNYHDDNY